MCIPSLCSQVTSCWFQEILGFFPFDLSRGTRRGHCWKMLKVISKYLKVDRQQIRPCSALFNEHSYDLGDALQMFDAWSDHESRILKRKYPDLDVARSTPWDAPCLKDNTQQTQPRCHQVSNPPSISNHFMQSMLKPTWNLHESADLHDCQSTLSSKYLVLSMRIF